VSQPRVPAGSPGGGRFATAECPRVYALLDTLAPEPEEDPHKPWRVAVPAARCPHGHFARWAARNCCAAR
jgi:hypothetical protein